MENLSERKRRTVSQTARLVEVSTSTVWRWIISGTRGRKLKSVLIGGRRWVFQSDLEEFIAGGRDPPPPKTTQADECDRATAASAELARRGV